MPAVSSGLPGSSGGPPSNAPCLTLLQVGFTEPPGSPRALVVSYTTVSPLPDAEAPGGLFSVALSRGSPRVGVTHHLALWSPDFPRQDPRAPPRPPGQLVHCLQFYGLSRKYRTGCRPGRRAPSNRRGSVVSKVTCLIVSGMGPRCWPTDMRRLFGCSLDGEQGRSHDAAVVEQARGHDRCPDVQQRKELVGLLADASADHEQVGGEDELHVLVERP